MSMKKHRARHNAMGTKNDTDDQRRLREVVCQELEDVLRKHDCGGVVFASSRESSAWRFVLPVWGGIVIEGPGLMRIRISTRTSSLREIADTTMHYVSDMRDLVSQSAIMFMDMFTQVEAELKKTGASIDHDIADMSPPRNEDLD